MGIHARLDQLAEKLKAEIVVQEEKSHIEPVEHEQCFHGQYEKWTEDGKKIDQPRDAYPDTETREKARQELQQIYDNSRFYQFRVRRRIRNLLGSRLIKREEEPEGTLQSSGDDVSDYRGYGSGFRG